MISNPMQASKTQTNKQGCTNIEKSNIKPTSFYKEFLKIKFVQLHELWLHSYHHICILWRRLKMGKKLSLSNLTSFYTLKHLDKRKILSHVTSTL